MNFENKYKIAGAIGGMQVTYRSTVEVFLYKFAINLSRYLRWISSFSL
jgi:hypothetical protein